MSRSGIKYFLVIEEVTAECGSYLTQQPIKMETLMVETKQKLTKHEKRRAEREYNQEKVTANTHGTYSRGRGRAIIYPDQRTTSLYQRSQPAAIQPRPPPTLQPASQPSSIKLDIAPSASVGTGNGSVKGLNEPKTQMNLFPTNLTPRSTDSPNISNPASSNQNILPSTNQSAMTSSSAVTSSQPPSQPTFADNERLLNFYPTRTQESIVPPWKSSVTPTLNQSTLSTPTQSLTSRLTGGLHGLNDDSLSHFLNSFPISTGAATMGTNQNGFSNNSLPTKPTHTVPSTTHPLTHQQQQPMGIGGLRAPPNQSSRFFGHPQLTSNSLFDSKSLFQDISTDPTPRFPSFGNFNPLMSNPNHSSNQNGLISSLLNTNPSGPAGPTTHGQVVINDSE